MSGHTGADDVVADVEDFGGAPSSLFIFMGLHSGLLSVVGAPGLTTVNSLRGKQLAVDARASGFVFILEKLLRSKGFVPDDYKFVEIGGVDKRYHACWTVKLPPPFRREIGSVALFQNLTIHRIGAAG
jgi:ABC-type nitrate/sulfonate/bicarbonate transport system substrate-binding protein